MPFKRELKMCLGYNINDSIEYSNCKNEIRLKKGLLR